MLQCLAQFRVALLEFFEQPDILDRNDRLIGEGFKKRDLLVRERPNFRAANKNDPDWHALAQQWRGKDSPSATALLVIELDSGNSASTLRISHERGSACRSRTARPGHRASGDRHSSLHQVHGIVHNGDQAQNIAIDAKDLSIIRVAQPRGIFRH